MGVPDSPLTSQQRTLSRTPYTMNHSTHRSGRKDHLVGDMDGLGGMSLLMGFGMLLGMVVFIAIVALAVVGAISLTRRGGRGDRKLETHHGREPDDESRA